MDRQREPISVAGLSQQRLRPIGVIREHRHIRVVTKHVLAQVLRLVRPRESAVQRLSHQFLVDGHVHRDTNPRITQVLFPSVQVNEAELRRWNRLERRCQLGLLRKDVQNQVHLTGLKRRQLGLRIRNHPNLKRLNRGSRTPVVRVHNRRDALPTIPGVEHVRTSTNRHLVELSPSPIGNHRQLRNLHRQHRVDAIRMNINGARVNCLRPNNVLGIGRPLSLIVLVQHPVDAVSSALTIESRTVMERNPITQREAPSVLIKRFIRRGET